MRARFCPNGWSITRAILALVDRSGGSSRPLLADARRLRELQGLRFDVTIDSVSREAFAVRWKGRVYAFVNVCRHQLLALDFGDAHFFDDRADAIVCCHHGARYRPDTGECIEGPCAGARLTPVAVEERDGALWLVPAGRR